MLKVLHLISTDVFSGAENVACQIISGFSNDSNYKMWYVTKIGSNKKSLEDRKITYYTLKKFNYRYIKKAINELQPDIIHAHDAKASIVASLFYKKAKIISHIHGNHENMRKLTPKTFLYNLVTKHLSKIIWVSESCLKDYYYADNVRSKSIILYNVINPKEIMYKAKLDPNKYSYDLIYLGRLSYPKNPLRLIDIVKKVVDNRPETTVAIVGTGELEQDVKNKIYQEKLERNIRLFGFQSNPYKILKSSKLMIMTSRYEGTPMCALEAIASGVPIISTPTDGLCELIENGKNGYIGYNNTEIVNTILMILNDKRKLQNLHSSTKETNDKINNINNYIQKVKIIYESKEVK